MNRSIVARLILKDWYLSRGSLALIAGGAALCVAILWLHSETSGFVGISGAFIATIFLSILLPMQTVLNERKKQNLAFVMSLPVSPMEYTMAKVAGNLVAFFVVWLVIVAAVLITISSAGPFGGLIPVSVVVAFAPFVAFSLLLGVTIVVESETWALVTMGVFNVSYSFAWYFLLKVPGIKEQLKSPVAIWGRPILMILAAEIALIVVALGLTFLLQSRKRNFI